MSELEVDAEILSNEDFLEHDSFSLKSISSCVLSSFAGIKELDEAINDSVLNKNPDLIIIETSGGCHPDAPNSILQKTIISAIQVSLFLLIA